MDYCEIKVNKIKIWSVVRKEAKMSTAKDLKVGGDGKEEDPILKKKNLVGIPDDDDEEEEGGGKTRVEVMEEAAIKVEDVIRAGGFGARDDISSVLPVAMDSTDFEASLRYARDYEEENTDQDSSKIEQGNTTRAGLGWINTSK